MRAAAERRRLSRSRACSPTPSSAISTPACGCCSKAWWPAAISRRTAPSRCGRSSASRASTSRSRAGTGRSAMRGGPLRRSASLWDEALPVVAGARPARDVTLDLVGPRGEPLRLLSRAISLPGREQPFVYSGRRRPARDRCRDRALQPPAGARPRHAAARRGRRGADPGALRPRAAAPDPARPRRRSGSARPSGWRATIPRSSSRSPTSSTRCSTTTRRWSSARAPMSAISRTA